MFWDVLEQKLITDFETTRDVDFETFELQIGWPVIGTVGCVPCLLIV